MRVSKLLCMRVSKLLRKRVSKVVCKGVSGNDLHSMMDVGKSADLILLVIDASFGFEMETFEFLNILQVRPPPHTPPLYTYIII